MKKKVTRVEAITEFEESIASMPADSKIFVDKSLEIADYIFLLMEHRGMKQKDLADKMGKTEAEISKLLAGMHNYTLRSIAKIEAALGSTVICTPKSIRVSFPVNAISKSSYAVSEKKTCNAFSSIEYGAKVFSISHKNINQSEPIAI
jgi:transcriptional regulator with XRE-family HTH domain